MKIHFQGQNIHIESAEHSLFEILGSVHGVQIHSPCGGRGTCKKCLVGVLAEETAQIPDAADAPIPEKERADFLEKCHVPAEISEKIRIVYACLVGKANDIQEVFLPDYEQLTGAGVSDSGESIVQTSDFKPVVKCKKLTLTKPTIEFPVDTYTNLTSAIRDAFLNDFALFGESIFDDIVVPDPLLQLATASVRDGNLHIYATVCVEYLPGCVQSSDRCRLVLTHLSDEWTVPLALACDIGTTTIATSVWRMDNGTLLGERVTENPQRRHGSDVISRMSYAAENGTQTLFEEVLTAVSHSVDAIFAPLFAIRVENAEGEYCTIKPSADAIQYVTIAGNSTMQHLFANLTVDSISTVPFFLSTKFGYTISAQSLLSKSENPPSICAPNAPIYFAPLAASYVGGDITFGLAYLLTKYANLENSSSIFLDLGTNGEICCINTKNSGENADTKYLFAATAAGPALEGAHIEMGMSATEGAIYDVQCTPDGEFLLKIVQNSSEPVQPIGICGSGVISAISAFLRTGLVTAFGRICDDGEPEDEEFADIYPNFEEKIGENEMSKLYIRLSSEPNPVVITESDIRQVQTAKASISAGTSVLLAKAGIEPESVDDLYIAGSFGGGIDVNAAAHIGLLPADAVKTATDSSRPSNAVLPTNSRSESNIHAVGNTSAKGAAMFLFSEKFRENLAEIMQNSAYIELSSDPLFTEEFVNGMLFGEIE